MAVTWEMFHLRTYSHIPQHCNFLNHTQLFSFTIIPILSCLHLHTFPTAMLGLSKNNFFVNSLTAVWSFVATDLDLKTNCTKCCNQFSLVSHAKPECSRSFWTIPIHFGLFQWHQLKTNPNHCSLLDTYTDFSDFLMCNPVFYYNCSNCIKCDFNIFFT